MPGMNLPIFGVVPVSSQNLSSDSRAISFDEKTRTPAAPPAPPIIVLLMNLAAVRMRLYVVSRSKLYIPSLLGDVTKRLIDFVTTCVPALMLRLCCSRCGSYPPPPSLSCLCGCCWLTRTAAPRFPLLSLAPPGRTLPRPWRAR